MARGAETSEHDATGAEVHGGERSPPPRGAPASVWIGLLTRAATGRLRVRRACAPQTIESTSKRTTLWAVVEFVAFASANCVQVLIVRRFFQSDPRRGRSKPAPHTYSYSLPGELQG